MIALDITTNTKVITNTDEFKKSNNLIGIMKNFKHSKSSRRKMSDSHKGRVNVKDKEGNIFIVDVNDVRYTSGELISANITGRKLTDEHKKKISDFNTGRKASDSTREKISKKLTGRNNTSCKNVYIYNNKDDLVIYQNALEGSVWLFCTFSSVVWW